jgi:TonB family protein
MRTVLAISFAAALFQLSTTAPALGSVPRSVPALGQQSSDEPIYGPGQGGVTFPVPIKQIDPEYTDAAKKAKIQGEVKIEGVVEPDGSLDQLKILQSLDTVYGLDQASLDAAGKWKFAPGKKDGKPVRVRVQIMMEFRLQ